jgi:precorrin isomerase
VNQAIELLTHENEMIRQRTIIALGRINYQKKIHLEPVVVAKVRSELS